jgi:hypothetical protein
MHDHTGSGDYILPIRATGGAVPLDFQENFRWCNKCQVLSWGGASSPGPCQAGGEHNHTGSGNYMVGYVVGADAVLHDALVAAYKPKA